MNKKIAPVILLITALILYILGMVIFTEGIFSLSLRLGADIFFLLGIIGAIINAIKRIRAKRKSNHSDRKTIQQSKKPLFILLALIIFISLIFLFIKNNNKNNYFAKNLNCELLKGEIQYNHDNYSPEYDSVINKISDVFYSPKLKKCLYISVSSFDIDAPLNQTQLTTKDYSNGARWKLRTISGEIIEDYIIKTSAEELFAFGIQPESLGEYEDFEKALKKWR